MTAADIEFLIDFVLMTDYLEQMKSLGRLNLSIHSVDSIITYHIRTDEMVLSYAFNERINSGILRYNIDGWRSRLVQQATERSIHRFIIGLFDAPVNAGLLYNDGTGSDIECPICRDTINGMYWLCDTCCHSVCRACIDEWLAGKLECQRKCPVCRSKIGL